MNSFRKEIKQFIEAKKDIGMKSIIHAASIKRLIVAITLSSSFLAHAAFSAVIPAYERLEPIKNHLSNPTAIALDLNENVYVTESIKTDFAYSVRAAHT